MSNLPIFSIIFSPRVFTKSSKGEGILVIRRVANESLCQNYYISEIRSFLYGASLANNTKEFGGREVLLHPSIQTVRCGLPNFCHGFCSLVSIRPQEVFLKLSSRREKRRRRRNFTVEVETMAVDTNLNFQSLLESLKVEDPWLPPRTWESIPSQCQKAQFPPHTATGTSSSSVSVSYRPFSLPLHPSFLEVQSARSSQSYRLY